MIFKSEYKGRPSVIVESDQLRATVLYEDGAKIASLVSMCDGKEFLSTKQWENYRVLGINGNYVESECSAFDDMFPTIDPYTPTEGEYKGITYPDHGESCRISYSYEINENSVSFYASSKIFPIKYKKTVTPSLNGGIDVEYSIENLGDAPFECIWAGHIMLQGELGMRLITPFSENSPVEMIFCSHGHDFKSLPKDKLMLFDPLKGAAYKFYYLEKISEGYFGAKYPDGRKLMFRYDKEKLPYLGVWLNNGEFQGIYNIAPEPCTVPFDSPQKARKKGYVGEISARDKLTFCISISLK